MLEWVRILHGLPEGPIDWACRNWHDSPEARTGFKPVPAQIKALAVSVLPKRSPAEIEREQEAERLRLAPPREVLTEERRAEILEEMGFSERRMNAILGGRRMPPPGHMTYDPMAEPAQTVRTVEEIVAQPYTDEQIARTRAAHGYPHNREDLRGE